MENPTINTAIEQRIFSASEENFDELALSVFKFQYHRNEIYKKYCDLLKIQPYALQHYTEIPFLPIQFFKTHSIKTTEFTPEAIFESSGTTQTTTSKHYVKSMSLYKKSFLKTFELFYGEVSRYCILCLLPSYLERTGSSLVSMTNDWVNRSEHSLSGFFLDDYEKLHNTILHNEIKEQPTILLGVTYALIDFAKQYPMNLKHTIVMETGGMKGKKAELTRSELHDILKTQLGLKTIHSEYGMTELLSQAYSTGDGIFICPPWMKILLREEDDPFFIKKNSIVENTSTSGLINVIDLCNLYSCSFIATDDIGKLYPNDSFEVLGRLDNSDIRGCSLMTI